MLKLPALGLYTPRPASRPRAKTRDQRVTLMLDEGLVTRHAFRCTRGTHKMIKLLWITFSHKKILCYDSRSETTCTKLRSTVTPPLR